MVERLVTEASSAASGSAILMLGLGHDHSARSTENPIAVLGEPPELILT